MNQTIRLEKNPSRIVSLVPSQTELLFDLGLTDEVVGITKFCIYPDEWFHSKTRVGGTKRLNINIIKDLKPDLIIGNKEENTKEDIEQLAKIAPVWMSDIYSIDDALQMIQAIGELVGRPKESLLIVKEIKQKLSQISKITIQNKVLYFIWKNPNYVAGKYTFIDSMLKVCGLINICEEERYPEWKSSNTDLPNLVFLSSEPYPFKEEHILYFQNIFPTSKILMVDGEMFSWYGSRMILAANYFQKLLNQLSNK